MFVIAADRASVPPQRKIGMTAGQHGFPAASYAQMVWHSVWTKVYFPAEFIAAVLANWGGYYSLNKASRLGTNDVSLALLTNGAS